MRCRLHLTLLPFAVMLSACGALDPIPLHQLTTDGGIVRLDNSVDDAGLDAALADAGPLDGQDAGEDMGAPIETAIERWFAEACTFARRCEAKEPQARMFQTACVAPPGVGLEQLLPPTIHEQLQHGQLNDVLPDVLEAYLTRATAECDIGPFLEPDRIFVGRRPDGDLCVMDYDCDSQHCATSRVSCDSQRCLPRRTTGDLCSRDGTCPLGDYCAGGVCAPLPSPGAPCPGGRCVAGAACTDASICVPRGELGDSCTRAATGSDTCGADLVCTRDGGGTDSHCTVGRAIGAPCDATRRPCANELRCESGACMAAGVTGTACTGDHQCVDGFACTEGRCAPRPLLGEPCSLAPCMIGLCRSGTCQHPTAGFSCSTVSLLDPAPGCKDSYCDAGLCRSHAAPGAVCVSGADTTCGPLQACGGDRCQPRGDIGVTCGHQLPPCLPGLTCVGPDGAQTCQACE